MTKPRWWFGQGHEPAWGGGVMRSQQETGDDVVDALMLHIHRLHAAVQQQGLELERLRAAFGVVTDIVRESDLIDAQELEARLEAAVGAVTADDGDDERQPSVVCDKCGREVPPNDTYITLDGDVCTACFNAAEK